MATVPGADRFNELTKDIGNAGTDAQGIKNALAQIDEVLIELQNQGVSSNDDAKKVVVAGIMAAAAKKNGNAVDVYNSYPKEVRDKLQFTPENLERNQEVTVLGIKVAAATLVASLVGGIVTTALAARYATLLPGWLRIATPVAIGAIITAFLVRINQTVLQAVNHWNDTFHWGPIFLAQLDKQQKQGGGVGSSAILVPKTRITMTKTAKPQVLLGTLFSQVVKRTDAFERQTDDEITSSDDLKTDAQVNLNKWLAGLPGRLIYTVNVAKDPFDENGLKQGGYWATLGILVRGISGRTVPVDTILLGPIKPEKYMPTSQQTSSIQIELPKLLTADEIAEVQLPSSGLMITGADGSRVPLKFGEGSAPSGAGSGAADSSSSSANTGPKSVTEAGGTKREEEDAEKIRSGQLKPYVRFQDKSLLYARLTGRRIPLEERGSIPESQIENLARSDFSGFRFSTGKVGEDFRNRDMSDVARENAIDNGSTPYSPPGSSAAPTKRKYVRFVGSPNIFNRSTGEYISETRAKVLGDVIPSNVEDFYTPRQEVRISTDFAKWDGKNLTAFPV